MHCTNVSVVSTEIIKIPTEDHIPEAVQSLLKVIKYPLILMQGQLGAGKTTITKEILQQKGSLDIGTSPSYSLINQYKGENEIIYHIDLYRLEQPQEAFNLGLEEVIYSGLLCIIEWPELILDYIEPPFTMLKIEVEPDGSRVISLIHEDS